MNSRYYKTAFRLSFLCVIIISSSFKSFAQGKVWSLEDCINYALENNIAVQQSELTMESAQKDYTQSMFGALPSLNASASHSFNFGQRIDPFTNQFATTQVRSNSVSLSSSFLIFNGFQTLNSIKRSDILLEARKSDLAKMKNDISLNIANVYLQILFNTELLKNAENQLKVTDIQIGRIQKMVDAGSLPEGSLRDIEAQRASEELRKINAENQLNLSLLNLAQMLRLENADEFDIQIPSFDNIDEVKDLSTPGALYQTAVGIMPEIKSAEYSYESAIRTRAIARGGYSPRLSVTGSLGSGYSGNNKELHPDGRFLTKPFNEQLDDNFNKSVGFSLNIPIFNGLSTRTNVQKAKIGMQQAELNLENTKLQLRQNIEAAHNDALAALKRFNAAKKSVEALELAFDYTKQRFDVGMVNSFDFNNDKNRLANSRSELLQAKYEYIFKTRVLDFYQGKAISLK